MLPKELIKETDQLWQNFWPISQVNPLSVLEFLSNLVYLKRVDSSFFSNQGKPMSQVNLTSEDEDSLQLQWDYLRSLDEEFLYTAFADQSGVFERINNLIVDDPLFNGIENSLNSLVPTSSLLFQSFHLIDKINLNDTSVAGEFYDLLLEKAFTATELKKAIHEELITPIIQQLNLSPGDRVLNLHAGDASFLVHTSSYISRKAEKYRNYKNLFSPEAPRQLIAIDSNPVVARIGIMNMMLKGLTSFEYRLDNPLSKTSESLIRSADVIFAHIPESASVSYDNADPALLKYAGMTRKSAVYLHRIISSIRVGARAAIIVPEEVLKGMSGEQDNIRKSLIESNVVECVVKLPAAANHDKNSDYILFFRKASAERTERLLYFELQPALDTNNFGTDSPEHLSLSHNRWNEQQLGLLTTLWERGVVGAETISTDYKYISIGELRDRNYLVASNPLISATEQEVVTEIYENPSSVDEERKRIQRRNIAIAAILAGLVAIASYFLFANQGNGVPRLQSPPPLVTTDSHNLDDGTGDSIVSKSSNKVADVKAEPPKPGPASDESTSQSDYKVIEKAYFHNEPNAASRRNAYIIHWNNSYAKINSLEEKNGFIYVEFTNHLGQVSKGWLKKSDLKLVE